MVHKRWDFDNNRNNTVILPVQLPDYLPEEEVHPKPEEKVCVVHVVMWLPLVVVSSERCSFPFTD